jgi:hypothetical protein
MYSSKQSASSEAPSYSDLAPRLLRFFQLLIGEQALAERLAIETLVEGTALGGAGLSNGMSVALVQCAVKKARAATGSSAPSPDKLVRAVRSLPLSQRVAVVLFRGLGLPLDEVATVTATSVRQARRLCAEGLLAIHQSLTVVDTKCDSTAGKQTGEF